MDLGIVGVGVMKGAEVITTWYMRRQCACAMLCTFPAVIGMERVQCVLSAELLGLRPTTWSLSLVRLDRSPRSLNVSEERASGLQAGQGGLFQKHKDLLLAGASLAPNSRLLCLGCFLRCLCMKFQ